MPYKKILIPVAALAVFALAGLAGLYGYDQMRMREDAALVQSFTPPSIPAPIRDGFGQQFSTIYTADRAMTLPEEPFADANGDLVKISDFRGQPLLINFWATWCTPCMVEMPELKRFADHYAGKLKVIGVALEVDKGPAEIHKFLENRNLGDFAAYSDKGGRFAGKLGLRGVPTSFLIGSNGLILYRFEGDADWTSAQAKSFFDYYLAHQPGAKTE